MKSQVCPVTWHESLLLWTRCCAAESTRGQRVERVGWVEWKTQEGVNRNTFQAPYILKEQPTAVSSVVTSLLLLGHEPFHSALAALKGIPFICRGSGPSIRKQMRAFPPLCCRDLFFCYSKVCYGLTIETWSWPYSAGRAKNVKCEMVWLLLLLPLVVSYCPALNFSQSWLYKMAADLR
jgi:hypothetical protein